MNKMIRSFENIGDRKKGAKIKANAINDFIGAIRTEVTIKGRGR